jgi:glucosamine-6-phosphate deaminase
MMEITYFKNYDDLSQAANDWCQSQARLQGAKSLYIPAGQTPVGLYKIWETTKPSFLSDLKLIQIDEVMSGNKKLIFKDFFLSHLPSFVDRVEFIGEEPNYADIGVLGLGTNGHVAFHEPSVDPAFSFGHVELTEATKANLGIHGDVEAVSYGVGAFMKTKALLLLVAGKNKKAIYEHLKQGREDVPAVWLTSHNMLQVFVDESAIL